MKDSNQHNPFHEMMARAETAGTIIDPFARAVSVNAILGEHQAVMNRLVESRRRAITEAHERGYSYQQLADALAISKTAVAKIGSAETVSKPLAGVQTFKDNDRGYLDWLDAHLDGYVLNCQRTLARSGLRLHHASCRTIRGTPPRGGPWTGPYVKVCCDSASQLRTWAKAHVGIYPSPCGACQPSSST